jgi:hypothetical protein
MTTPCCDKCLTPENTAKGTVWVCGNPTCECHGVKKAHGSYCGVCYPKSNVPSEVNTTTEARLSSKEAHQSDGGWDGFDEALEPIVYKNGGYFIGMHGDSECNEEVGTLKAYIAKDFIHRDSLRREVEKLPSTFVADNIPDTIKPGDIIPGKEYISRDDLIRLIDQK